MSDKTYVSKMYEYAQRTGLQLRFDCLGSDGPDNDKTHTMQAVLNDRAFPPAVAAKKQDAKQKAAENAYRILMDEEQDSAVSDERTAEASAALTNQASPKNPNYISWLNQYGQEMGVHVQPVESHDVGPSSVLQCCHFKIGDVQYPTGTGRTKKEAKEKAAKLAYDAIRGQPSSETAAESTVSGAEASPRMSARPESGELSGSSSQNQSSSDWIRFENSTSASDCRSFTISSVSSEGDTSNRESLSSSSSSMQRSTNSSGVGIDSHDSSADEVSASNETPGVSHPETTPDSKFTTEYDSIQRISSGGYGCVFKARLKLVKRNYAVKVVRSEEEALREVQTLSDLHHPNIVRYHMCWEEETGYKWDEYVGRFLRSARGRTGKFLYIQMELCDTKTLRDWIEDKNENPPTDNERRRESLDIARQIVSGVEYIHSMQKIHRDLKPENILFGLDGKMKIGDFGLVAIDDPLLERTSDRGTQSYMAPEQFESSYDRKVDIFPLGLVYFELLWKFSTGHERIKVLNEVRLQRLPEGFSQKFFKERRMILWMLSKKPEDRPEASTLREELAQLLITHQENRTM